MVRQIMDVAPYLRSDRVYLPLRFVASALGVSETNIKWNELNQSVEIKKENNVISMTVGSNIMYINNAPILMDVAPEFVEPGRIMIPLRWAAQGLGVNVYWDSTSQQVALGNF